MGNFGTNNPYSSELPFGVERYLGSVDTDKLARCSVEWIVNNKRRYTKETDLHKNLFNKLEVALSSQTSTEGYIELLRLFNEAFLNNPFVYERRLTKLDKTKKICSSRIECYLVLYKDMYLPIGVLDKYIEIGQLRDLIRRFLENRMKHWIDIINKDIEICGRYMGGSFASTMSESIDAAKGYFQKTWSHWIKLVIIALIMLLAVFFVANRLVIGVDWENAGTLFAKTDNVFQAIGFMTEKGYGINHNSWLNCAYIFLSVIWAIATLCFIAPLKNCIKMYIGYMRRNQLSFRAKTIERKLMALVNHCEAEIKDNCSLEGPVERLEVAFYKGFGLFSMMEKLERDGLPKNVSVKREMGVSGKVPGFKALIVFLVFALGTVYFSARSSDVEFVSKANSYMQEIHSFADGFKTYAKKEYVVAKSTTVYTKSTKESLALYELTTGNKFYIVDDAGEGIQKVRFNTEYGYLSGWVFDASFWEYSPENDKSVVALLPMAAKASRTDFGDPANAIDGRVFTAWGLKDSDDFIEDYVELELSEETDVNVLMIQPGSNFFGTNTRPSEIRVEFYNASGRKKSVAVKLEDSAKKQYFTMNKGIAATKVRFVITDYIKGTRFNNLYITDLGAYGSKPVE